MTSTLIPMRWSDLDSLNHVNNVVYIEYAMEAREASGVAADVPVRSTRVEFKRPILLSRTPVNVLTEIDSESIRQEIRVGQGETVFATVTSALGAPEPVEPELGPPAGSLWLRRRDARAGMVDTTRWFELFQETRIPFFTTLLSAMSPGRFVVAVTEVSEVVPVRWRVEPFTTRSWIEHVGTSSFSVVSQVLADDDTVVAHSRSVLVGFDLGSQTSRALDETEKAELRQGMLS